MSGEATPAPAHEPPSLPASPLPKRTKYTEPAAGSVASILNDSAPTPTPHTANIPLAPVLPSVSTMEPSPPSLQVKLLSETAKAPTRGSAFAAGYDLYASKAGTIPARGKAMIDTDISIAVPAGTYGRVAPRSGLASKHSIDTGAGVIDADYRGPVKVLLFNFGENEFKVEAGDRIAQLIIERRSLL
ncbi:hypothetical protein AMS68_000949 [Peltaster fructicola]|uniref:Deoxyuridine 5'-triphosphate nucleotidohydrolase n=1 Tax=Peltaster fructicola TaxID=286661 RepID=A0A6H0XL10_9PEZI|nr:hypothetical protein AMS68_000949 [Peltaster fructicola]